MAKNRKTGLFLFHRAGTGEISQFIKERYPENDIRVISVKNAIESGIIPGNIQLPPVYKAFFVEAGPIEQHPQAAVLSDISHEEFYQGFHNWYFGEGRARWVKAQNEAIRAEIRDYYS